MHNEVFIHTDKGSYVGGEHVFGTVFLSIHHPVPAKALMFEIVGYEETSWVEHRTEFYQENGEQKSRQVEEKRHGHRDFFRDSVPLISYPGGFPMGQFNYPFQYRLPDDLPGVFFAETSGHDRFKAKIQYKVKAVLEIGHGKHISNKQHLYVNEKLNLAIAPRHMKKSKTVRTCCCIGRGDVHCEAWMDKNAYMHGETAQVHVDVNNESSVEVRHFNTKLIKHIRLSDDRGHTKQIRHVVASASYGGTGPKTQKNTPVPLALHGGNIVPSTSSRLVSCEYQFQIELDIPWAPDLDIFVPCTIYSPQNQAWSAWQPPTWAAQAQLQAVAGQLAVPQQYIDSHMQNGFFHQASAPPAENPAYAASASGQASYGGAQASFGASASYGSPVPPHMNDPTRPLLG